MTLADSTPKLAPALSLELLMAGYQRADESAATAFIERVGPLLLNYFYAQPSCRRIAEDLVQETWIRIHNARHVYRPGEAVLPWIFAIARHAGLDAWRRTRRLELRETPMDELPHPPGPQPPDPPIDIDSLLNALPESQREVLVMLKVSGMSVEEVARATCASPGSVKQKAHRAYEKLRTMLTLRKESR